METEEKIENSYKGIFKSTALFGFVQGFTLIVKIGINKAVALLLGAEGMGVIGLFQSTINILRIGFDLGISQSAVRDISEAKNISEKTLGGTISLLRKLVFFTSLLGLLVTLILAPSLSKWTFGTDLYKYAFMALSVVVFLTILTEGQLAVLKGLRYLKILAKASLFGSIVGLFTTIPLYFFLRENGIVPSLIIAALTAFLYSWFYVSKISYKRHPFSLKNVFFEGRDMIKMGISLMYVNLLTVIGDYIIRAYINHTASLEMVGFFQAGSVIISTYFGVILTALSTDYYPRISAINNKDDIKLSKEFNKQCEVSVLLIGNLIIVFLFCMSLGIKLLYTSKFLIIIDYLELAVFGLLLLVCAGALGMILVVKQAVKIYFFTATVHRTINVLAALFFFRLYGLSGLGYAYIFSGIFHIILLQIILWKNYNIRIEKNLAIDILTIIIFCASAFFIRRVFDNSIIQYLLGAAIFCLCMVYSFRTMKKRMNIDVIQYIKSRIRKDGY
jgi:PST family polysaccharide transporter